MVNKVSMAIRIASKSGVITAGSVKLFAKTETRACVLSAFLLGSQG